jgi:hypothetical protein
MHLLLMLLSLKHQQPKLLKTADGVSAELVNAGAEISANACARSNIDALLSMQSLTMTLAHGRELLSCHKLHLKLALNTLGLK